MKAFILKLITVIGLLIIIDYLVAVCFSSLLKNWPDDGSPLSIDNMCFNKIEPDLLLLGASQVQHGYNSDIFAQKLGIETYNAGQNGIDVIQNYMYFKAVCDRKMPKIVIYDVYPAYLDGSMKYRLRKINMWYRLAPSVSEYFDNRANWQERLKLHSGLYVYNGFPAHMARAYFRKESNTNGFVPLYGKYDGGFSDEENFIIDEEELEYLEKIVSLCKDNGCHLYFSQVPNYIPNRKFKEWLKEYCLQRDITLLSHVDDTVYLNRPSLFRDNCHLNREGADLFTEELANEVFVFEKVYNDRNN